MVFRQKKDFCALRYEIEGNYVLLKVADLVDTFKGNAVPIIDGSCYAIS